MRRIWLDTLILLLLCAAAPLWLALAYTGQRSAVFGASDLSAMLPMEGVHEQENLADRPGTFRWTDGSARIQPPNPGGELQLLLRLSSGLDEVTPVVLRAGKGDTQSFFALPGLRTYYLLLPSQPGERVTIAIESPTRTIDRRDLGVVFSGLSIVGTGSPPPLLIGAMLLATVGVYLLLCQAQFGQVAAPAIILVLQAAMAAWQYVGLWRYGLLSSLLGAVGVAALVAIGIEHIFLALPRQERPIAAPIRFRDLLRPPHLIPLVLLLMLAIACCLPWQHKPDPVGDLELAARRMGFMYERGGLNQAFVNGSDLMPFWLYTLCVLAPFVHVLGGTFYDPVPDITHTLIKVPSMLSLLATVTLLYWWGVRYANQRRAILIAALYAAIPPVWINAAWWGQVDVLISLPMIASLLLLDYGRGRW
ncbi:MAG: hypothetical protein HGA65_10715, partial [Oscillochloris sp.]|nr:hypothetical protein [Oscillochloris sp.]